MLTQYIIIHSVCRLDSLPTSGNKYTRTATLSVECNPPLMSSSEIYIFCNLTS